jgi:hypothetical protein
MSDVSLKTFVMYLVLSDSLSKTELLACLRRRRTQVTAQQKGVQQALAQMENQELALEYGLAMAEAELAWLDEAVERLSGNHPSPRSREDHQKLKSGEVREE